MPNKSQALPLRFTVVVKGETLALTSEELNSNPDVPYGSYSTTAPCVGDITYTKFPKCIFEQPEPEQVYRDYKDTIDILADYVGSKAKQVDHLKCILDLLNKSIDDKYLFMQCIFSIFIAAVVTVEQQQEMFKVLVEELQQDLHPILCLILFDKKQLKFALNICGPAILTLMNGDYPIEFQMAVGNFALERLDIVKQFWQQGGNPNRAHYKFGTLLHALAANESGSACIYLLEELAKQQTTPVFDFTTRDGEQKTILHIAAKTRLSVVVVKLCELHKKGIDVGIDIADRQGRSAIMLAAALGDLKSFEALSAAGAKTDGRDVAGRDLRFYANAPEDVVREILLSISIEPDRFVGAMHNWLYYSNAFSSPVAFEDSPHEHKMVLISFAPGHAEVLRAVLWDTYKQKDGVLLRHYLEQLRVFPDDETAVLWIHGAVKISGARSLLEVCMERQERIRDRIRDEAAAPARMALSA